MVPRVELCQRCVCNAYVLCMEVVCVALGAWAYRAQTRANGTTDHNRPEVVVPIIPYA